VQEYFVYDANATSQTGEYYLNNFEDLFRSGVTLFELTVVNNWFVIMNGYTIATDSLWTRLYFMMFYVITMIVMTIIVSVILEAFLFRIQYRKKVKNGRSGDPVENGDHSSLDTKSFSSFESVFVPTLDYGWSILLSYHFMTILNPISLFSCGVHVWVEFKACK
jgi:hypothetical protein